MSYASANVYTCRNQGHHFTVVGSDKTPMKRSLLCRTCSERTPGTSVYVAYGIEVRRRPAVELWTVAACGQRSRARRIGTYGGIVNSGTAKALSERLCLDCNRIRPIAAFKPGAVEYENCSICHERGRKKRPVHKAK